MADPVASVERIIKVGLRIKEAADTVRRNAAVCQEIRTRVLRFGAVLSQLQRAGAVDDSPAMGGALDDLEETHITILLLTMQTGGYLLPPLGQVRKSSGIQISSKNLKWTNLGNFRI
jgi:hypothetical protein